VTNADKQPKWKHFSPFKTAAEEVSDMQERDRQETEGSHGNARQGRIVQTPDQAQPYKVVLQDHRGFETEHPFSTVNEAEAFIRSRTTAPPKRDSSRDQPQANRK
jgi:hypothetical protein